MPQLPHQSPTGPEALQQPLVQDQERQAQLNDMQQHQPHPVATPSSRDPPPHAVLSSAPPVPPNVAPAAASAAADPLKRPATRATAGDSTETPSHNGDHAPEVLRYLSDKNVTADDIRTTIRVLNAIATLHPKETENGLELFKDPSLRPLRKALAPCLEVQKRIMYGGEDEDSFLEKCRYEQSRKRQKVAEHDLQVERSRKRRKVAKKELQQQLLAKTGLRQGRMQRLVALQQQHPSHAHLFIADGHVDTNQLSLEDGGGHNEGAPPAVLPKSQKCYCCKVAYRQLHHFYDKLCPDCADLNFTKRHALAPSCRGKVAIVTGARVKIGYQTALKLLRSGATVVATSRFPNSAVEAYRREEDFAEFQSRLSVYGLDLRDVTDIEAFTRFIMQQFPSGIDILIHNACQTIRRPAAYYAPVVEQEQAIWRRGDDVHRQILSGCIQFERARCRLDRLSPRSSDLPAPNFSSPVLQLTNGEDHAPERLPAEVQAEMAKDVAELIDEDYKAEATTLVPVRKPSVATNGLSGFRDARSPFESTGVAHSAALSQVVVLPEDVGVSEDVLPPGAFDINGQQLDLRSVNSWVLKMDQVSTPEVLECFLVNAIAPFVLNSKLFPLLCMGDDATRPNRFIVNVSAMEGKFTRRKTPNHPHTNMAKSALNMLTRTSAEDLAVRHRVYMNSVDTGWVTEENPLERARKKEQTYDFQTPIDEIDAAARILDPIFSSLNGEVATPVYGKFLKDYKETTW